MLLAGAQVGGYRIEGIVGAGGMGVVYEATQLSLDRRVALKALRAEFALDPGFVERFRREGRLQASFHHPHAIEVYEAFEDEHGLFLALRLERGPTLAELLATGALDSELALTLLEHVAQALDAAHDAGLVHRDVKPSNVLVGSGSQGYLSDFGLTRAGDGSRLTGTGAMFGTLAYLAPEVISGEAATPASDRYAFAALAFECLSGTVPFPRQSHAAVLYAHTSEPPPRASGVRPELPDALDAVLGAGLAKTPGERPSRAADLVREIRAVIGSATLGPPAAPMVTADSPLPPTVPPRRRRASRAPLAIAAGLIAGAGLGAGAVAAFDSDGPSVPAGAAIVPVPAQTEGTQRLGSTLERDGRTIDCRGGTPRNDSPPCTVAQSELADGQVVIPEDGVISGWAIRGAQGELALQVLRPRAGGASQVSRSDYEFINGPSPHHFDANLEVSRGDVIALEVTRGGAFGLAESEGATTDRWFPTRRGKPPEPPDRGPGSGADGELLLRADYVPGGRRELPRMVTGARAAAEPDGRVVTKRGLTFTDGRKVVVEMVELDDGVVLDLRRDGRRVARSELPGFLPEGNLIGMYAVNYDDSEAVGEVGVEWVNVNSARVREHYFGVYPGELEFYD